MMECSLEWTVFVVYEFAYKSEWNRVVEGTGFMIILVRCRNSVTWKHS